MSERVNTAAVTTVESRMPAGRLRKLQTLGIFCGVVDGAWLGGAEAPKMVNPEVSPITVSLIMVFGVVLATAARVPRMDMHLPWAAALAAAMLGLLLSCGITLWRTPGFR